MNHVSRKPKRLNQSGFDHVLLAVAVVVVFALVGSFLLFQSRAASGPTVELQSEVGSNICVAGGQSPGATVYLAACNGSPGEQWQAAGGVIKNTVSKPGTALCLEPSGTIPAKNTLINVVSEVCSSGNKNQTWSGAGNPTALRNGGNTARCLVDPNNAVSASTHLGLIGCGSYADQTWNTHATFTASAPPSKPAPPKPAPPVASKTPCQSGSTGARMLCTAQRFDGFTYAPGGHEASAAAWLKACPAISNSTSGCQVDCSGLVNVAVYGAGQGWHDWTVNGNGYMTLGVVVDNAHWKTVSLASAQPGDLVMAADHVEMVSKGSGTWTNIHTFGAHRTGEPDSGANLASELHPKRLLRYNP